MDSRNLPGLIATLLIAIILVSSGSFSSCLPTNPDFCETQHKILVASTLDKMRKNTSSLDGAFDCPFGSNSNWAINSTVYDGSDKINVDNATVTCKHVTGSSYSVTFTVLLPPSRFVAKITVKPKNTDRFKTFTEQITLTSEGNNVFAVDLNYNNHYGSVAIKSINEKEQSEFYPRVRCPSDVPTKVCVDVASDVRDDLTHKSPMVHGTIYKFLQVYLSY